MVDGLVVGSCNLLVHDFPKLSRVDLKIRYFAGGDAVIG